MTAVASADHLGIVELVDVCRGMQRRNTALFERLGGWVRTTDGPVAQQLFAEACHRHAWHAQLWAERMPAIDFAPSEPSDDEVIDDPADTPARVAEYRDRLTDLVARHSELRRRVDARLDPSTARVLELVDADVAALAERVDALT